MRLSVSASGGQRRLVAVRAMTGDDEGYDRGQQCSYVVGEAAIEEEGSDGKHEAEKAEGEGNS
ncbi:hypothetical protein BHM03_00021723 [Ensete ventricosum]|nr:hypothetical protein BHM03_00021723 [Ensete ventricosum]